MARYGIRRVAWLCRGGIVLFGILAFIVLLLPLVSEAQQGLSASEREYVERYNTLTPQQQQSLRDRMTPDQRTHLDRLLLMLSSPDRSGGASMAPAISAAAPSGAQAKLTKKIIAGVPTQLTYTVVVQNRSGVPVVNPAVKDNGKPLNNDDAVKTGGNQDNILEIGETWTWTYTVTVTGKTGERILNTVTVEGPDSTIRDTDQGNNTDETVVEVDPAPGNYDLSVSKTVAVTGQADTGLPPGINPTDVVDSPPQTITPDDCGKWLRSASGGYKGTRKQYDIASLPSGTTFDLDFQAFDVPDKIEVYYPAGTKVFDSGWRGDMNHIQKKPSVANLYPGGVVGTGKLLQNGLFTKSGANEFLVIVYGPEQGTAWEFSVKANCP